MMRGVVNAKLDAVVSLTIRGPSGIETTMDAVIDSGFTAGLNVPATVIAALGLVPHSIGGAILADGSVRQFELFTVEVDWNGWRPLLACSMGDEVLIGMRLLSGYELRIAVTPGGVVEVTPLDEVG
jgi:clan AA aspartic protease